MTKKLRFQENIFFYLDDSSIPKDTNGLEAEFTHLKGKLNMHEGCLEKDGRVLSLGIGI